MRPITLASLLATKPCSYFPPERIEALLTQYGPFTSWLHLAEVARAADWPVSLEDLRLTAYRTATPRQRGVALRHSTRISVESQTLRWPTSDWDVSEVRRRLLAWAEGGEEDLAQIEKAAADNAYATAFSAAAYAAYATAFFAAAAAAPRASAYAYATAAAAYVDVASSPAKAAWESLQDICAILDGEE